MRYLFCLLLVLLMSTSVIPQKTMILFKAGSSRKYVYHYGDRLTVLAHQPQTKISGELNGMNDTMLLIGNANVRINDIHHIIRKTYLPGRIRELLLKGGVGFFAITTANNIINNDRVFNKTNLIITGAMLTAAVLTIPFNYRKIDMGGRWRIIVTESQVYK